MDKNSEKRLVYILVCLGCVTISFNIAAITAAIPVISVDLGKSDLLVSNIIPFYMIPYGIGALIYAPLTRSMSYRNVLGISMAVFALSNLMCSSSDELSQILFARILMGVSAASAIPLGLMIIGEFFQKNVRGRLVGVFFSSAFVASLAGLALGGVAHWRMLFTIPALLGALMSMSFLFLGSNILSKVHKGQINYLKVLSNVDIKRVFLFIFVLSALYHGVHKWFGVYLDRVYAMDKLTISFFFILSALGGLFGQLLGGFISDLKGRTVACFIGLIGLGCTTILLAGKYHLVFLGVVLILISMFWTVGHNGISTVLTDFPERQRPAIASLNSSVRFISGGLGFFISSLFVGKSFGLTFLVIGFLMLILSGFLKNIIPGNN